MGSYTMTVAGLNGNKGSIPIVADSGGRLVVCDRFIASRPATLAVSTTVYAANDNVGGVLSFPLTFVSGVNGGTVSSLLLIDKENVKPDLTIVFFNATPAGTYTDNAAVSLATDADKITGIINVPAASWVTIGGLSYANPKLIGAALSSNEASGTMYAVIIVNGTPTYAQTSSLLLKVITDLA